MLNYAHDMTQYPTNEQEAHVPCEAVFSSYKAKDGRFYVIACPAVAPVSKVIGVRHPLTNEPLTFPSRRAANAYCDLLNTQFAQAR